MAAHGSVHYWNRLYDKHNLSDMEVEIRYNRLEAILTVQSSAEPILINISHFDLVSTLKKVIKEIRIEIRFN